MHTKWIITTAIALAVGAALVAQAPAANPISSAIKANWTSSMKNLTDSAALMPESNYSFRPVDSVRTFGQILAHVAGANYLFCSAGKGEKTPHAEDEFEKSATTKAAIDKALADSVAYCDAVYSGLTDKTANDAGGAPFKMSRSGVLVMNIGHVNEHYGNLVTYFRIKGIVPPTSRAQ